MQDENTTGQAPLLESAILAIERMDKLIADANDQRIDGLDNVLSELGHLEEALVSGRAARIASFTNFETDKTLARLEKLAAEQRSEFDALDFIGQSRLGAGRGLWGSEEFHSNVLGWLLAPQQSHGYGDQFLKGFLHHAGMTLAVRSPDWSDTEVIREWEHVVDERQGFLDILIVNEAEQVLCAIENKVFSSEHSEQLTRYRKALELDTVYSKFTGYHVFLTRRGDLASRKEEREYWKPLTYSTVFDIVQQMLEDNENSTDENVRAFLRQYATTLRRNIMPDTSVPQLARKIYLEHWQAIEEIISHKPDWVAEAKQWFKEAIAQRPEWKLDLEEPKFIRFRSTNWDRYEATQHPENGWAPDSNALFLFQFRFDGEFPWLDLGLSPETEANNRLRQELFEAARQHPHLFRPETTTLRQRWAILHWEADSILDEADYGVGWDDGATRAKVEAWVAWFAESKFPAMNKVILDCLEKHKAEQQS